MSGTQTSVAEVAALIANPTRTNILMALMGGRAPATTTWRVSVSRSPAPWCGTSI
jgi:hypothetical protein